MTDGNARITRVGAALEEIAERLEANVPAELRRRRQWVVRKEKIPHNARTGARASAADSETWSTFEEALRTAFGRSPRGGRYDGVGFVFSSGDPYAGVDLDKCRDSETGDLEEWAAEIIRDLGGYAEASPSGTGVHVIVRGDAPNKKRGGVEAYSSRRYFTVTGEALEGAGVQIPERQAELDALTREHLVDPESGGVPRNAPRGYASPSGVELSDDEVIERCRKAKNAPLFEALYDAGDTSGHEHDASRADLALLNHLAFYTQDFAQLERLFGGSALGRRRKWRSRAGYRRDTINKALSGLGATYTPRRNSPRSQEAGPDSGTRYAVTPLRRPPVEGAPEFPTRALPGGVARLVEEAAKAVGCPPDAIGLAVLVALGTAIGNARVIQPKKGWTEGAAIYAAVIADSGEKKTASISAATGVVLDLDGKLIREHEEKLDEFAREEREYEVEKKDAAKQGLAAPPPPRPPAAERIHVNDTTIEALMPILKDTPRGVLLGRDELVGWVKSMDQYKAGGKGSDRQFWLSTWSNSPASVDRKGQARTLSVERPFVSVLGSIQPSVLGELSEGREDGMLERFLFVYPEPINSPWTDDEISDEAEASYRGLFDRLRSLGMGLDDHGAPVKAAVAFSDVAKELFVEEYDKHRREMRLPGFPQNLRSPWAKLEAYFLRIILILAACRFAGASGVPERVEADDVLRAGVLIGYFKAQARRVFGVLHGFDPHLRLVEDCARLVAEEGGTWTGTPTELHEQLTSDCKPERPDELSKILKEASEGGLGLVYESDLRRFKDENGTWKTRRGLRLSIENRRNGVTA